MKIVQKRYLKEKKQEKSIILDEIVQNLNCHRKSAIRLVNSDLSKQRKPTCKTMTYNKKVFWIIEELWKNSEYPSGIILKAQIPIWLEKAKKRYPIDPITERDILRISASTIDRRLTHKKKRIKAKIYSTTKPGRLIRSQVPIRTSSHRIGKPGSFEIDTVAHCGFSNAGEFIYTVNSVDIATGWVIRRAVLGKGQFGVQRAVDYIRMKSPFGMHEIDFDNGDEFLNWYLLGYCNKNNIGYTRSRPYKKDDQAHIEQKNSTHVRRVFGRVRLDRPAVLHPMNDLYDLELYDFHNFFKPSQKLLKKTFIGSRVKRTFDSPKTPYQRLMESTQVSKKVKHSTTQHFLSLDPFDLKCAIDRKLKNLFNLQTRKEKLAS